MKNPRANAADRVGEMGEGFWILDFEWSADFSRLFCSLFLVLGSWFLVLGSWFLVLGSWFELSTKHEELRNEERGTRNFTCVRFEEGMR